MEITNDILDASLIELLSDIPMTAMEMKRKVEISLGAKGYNTNMVTSTGQDNLYIKIKARLRRWAEKGLVCINVGEAKYIAIEHQNNYQAPTPTTRVRKSKGETVKETLEDQEIDEAQPIVVEQPQPTVVAQPQPIVVEQPQPIVVEQPKPTVVAQPQPKQTKTQTLKDASEIMNDLIKNKDFWIARANNSSTKLELQEEPLDLTCPRLRAMAIQSTKCFGKEYSAKNEECQVCPLNTWCKDNIKGSNRDSTVQAFLNFRTVSSFEEPIAQAIEEPQTVKERKPREKKTNPQIQKLLEKVQKEGKMDITLETDITCSISGDKLKKGDTAYYVNGFGVVSPKCFE
jgi:hypothetical protein